MSKIERERKMFVFVMIVICFIAFVQIVVESKPSYEIVDYEQCIIREGDTLWNLACNIIENDNLSIDVRRVVYDIKQMNVWDGDYTIHPGDEISLPIYATVSRYWGIVEF